jgi:ATP-dependent Clp protease ATP-binding subunit ClpA
VCRFNKLDNLAIKKVVIKFIDELKASLAERGVRITLSEAAVDLLAREGYDPKMGARPLGRKIDELVRVPLSKKILFEELRDCSIDIDAVEGALTFQDNRTQIIDAEPVPTVDENGYIKIDRFQPRP